jgi:Transposase
VQQATLEHRGWKADPLYDIRKLLLLGAERVDDEGWDRIHAARDAGDPDDELRDCWVAKEKVRDVYLTDDPELAANRLDDAIAWCAGVESGPELRRLVKTLRRWRAEILAHHRTGASNGPVEAANLLIKQIKRSGRGFRNLGQLPAPHPSRRRHVAMPNSARHEHPNPPTQVRRVGPQMGGLAGALPCNLLQGCPCGSATTAGREHQRGNAADRQHA